MGLPDLNAFRGMLPRELKTALEIEAEYPDRDPSTLPVEVADAAATVNVATAIVTPMAGTNAPGQQPNLVSIGPILTAEFTLDTDRAYRLFKIPSQFVGNAAVHVHWTKSVDLDESTKEVRWRLTYKVFPGGDGVDIASSPTIVTIDDTYDDNGTTTRLPHRTTNVPLTGFVAGYYLGIAVDATTPPGTPLAGEPALISVDLSYDVEINR